MSSWFVIPLLEPFVNVLLGMVGRGGRGGALGLPSVVRHPVSTVGRGVLGVSAAYWAWVRKSKSAGSSCVESVVVRVRSCIRPGITSVVGRSSSGPGVSDAVTCTETPPTPASGKEVNVDV